VIRTHEEHLAHYGILRKSGRYPWGSGGTEEQRSRDFLGYVENLRKDGMSETEIAQGVGMTTTELRASKAIATQINRQDTILQIERLKDHGLSNTAIAARMGINESSVRHYLAPGEKDKANALHTTANFLKTEVNEKQMIDVGKGVEAQLAVTKTRLDTALAMLKEEGYNIFNIKVQTGPKQYTTTKVLAHPDLSLQDVQRNRADIKLVQGYSDDYGRSFQHVQDPISVSSKRIGINYAEDGGAQADGVIYVRPGVKDLSIGSSSYAQVRIMVDNTHYLKGMAVYKDDLPDGIDLVFNTNKSSTGRKKDAMKELEADKDNPFGSITHQVPPDSPGDKVTSAMNIVGTKQGSGEEGSWDTWSKTLSTQMLSKQDVKLAQQQLDMTFERRLTEFNEINSLTNPTVRKDLLLKFADSTDAASVHLKAAALPRQATKVLLPVPSMKPTEIYAPTFRNGERVVLVRYPHGGTFEIPELTVNNRNLQARKIVGNAPDAVGIHQSVAQHLSGADFDGDHIIIIPNNRGEVKTTPALEELKGFDPHVYKIPEGSLIPHVTDSRKQTEMGKISNLITDMSLNGAKPEELARAVKHSMVVIDSEKHQLDFRQSEKDHGILALKEEYQGGKRKGASTLISRAGSEVYLRERKPRSASKGGPIDPVTGKKVYEETGRTYVNRKGQIVLATERSKRLAETEDPFALSSGTKMEGIYATHSAKLKALANASRKEPLNAKPIPYSKSAKAQYSNEVASLNAQLNRAEKNAPLERHAQLLANASVSQKRQVNPHMDPADVKKIRQIALVEARNRTGAHKDRIKITQKEWDAIQAGALSTHKLTRVLNNSDTDTVKKLAMPKSQPKMTATMTRRAEAMLARGYTQAEVADQLGVGLTTLKEGIN
jgi:predicted transcriptional regulator